MSTWRPTATGVLAAAAGLSVAEGLSALLDLRESPLVAVGQGVIAATPGPVAEAIIGVVGTADKPLAIASVVVGLLLLGALAGRWWPVHRWRAFALVSAMTAAAALAVVARPFDALPGVFAAVAGGVAMLIVLELLQVGSAADADPQERRAFLRLLAIVAIGVAVVGGGSQLLAARARRRREVELARAALDLPRRTTAMPVGAQLDVPGLGPWTVPNRDFYRIDTALRPPLIDPADWSLRIHGMVDREVTLDYADLVARGLSDAWVTLCCVSNPIGGDLIGNAVWGGVAIKDLLEEVGVRPGADALLSTSEDGWTCGTPLAALTDGRDALLAVTMNGEPLPIAHGFPVRQVVPGLYGYVSATKWVVDWEVTRFADVEAYWTQRGWGERGPVKTGSRVDVPRPGATVRAGSQPIAGVAWHQHVGIDGVQVRIDDGPWRQATLGRVPTADTWVQWSIDWEATAGEHVVEVRAVDATGEVQTADLADVLPDGATGHHVIDVQVDQG